MCSLKLLSCVSRNCQGLFISKVVRTLPAVYSYQQVSKLSTSCSSLCKFELLYVSFTVVNRSLILKGIDLSIVRNLVYKKSFLLIPEYRLKSGFMSKFLLTSENDKLFRGSFLVFSEVNKRLNTRL